MPLPEIWKLCSGIVPVEIVPDVWGICTHLSVLRLSSLPCDLDPYTQTQVARSIPLGCCFMLATPGEAGSSEVSWVLDVHLDEPKITRSEH